VKLPKSRKDSSCHFAFIGSLICNRGRVMKSLAPTTNFLLAASFCPTAGAPLLYVLSYFRKMACLHIFEFKFAEPFIDVDFDLQHAFRSQFHALELILRVLISILGIQIFDMIDAVVGNLEKAPSTERCSEIARSVIADYDEMRHDSENEGMRGLDSCYATFDRELRAEVDACGEEWMQLATSMRTTPADNPEELSRQLKGLLGNNARCLAVAGKQFMLTVVEFG
jgi:hypothetical protein